MNAIERCERYRDGEPIACADRLFSDGLVCGPCANLLTPARAPTYRLPQGDTRRMAETGTGSVRSTGSAGPASAGCAEHDRPPPNPTEKEA